MNIVVPHTESGLSSATQEALETFKPDFQLVTGIDGYPDLLQRLWDKKQTFIVVEQDVVPTSSQLSSLWECSESWCAFPYRDVEDFNSEDWICAYLGCAKLSESFIESLPDIWKDMPVKDWHICDCHLTHYAQERGFKVHQHTPRVKHLKDVDNGA